MRCWLQLNDSPPQNARKKLIYCAGSELISQAFFNREFSICYLVDQLFAYFDIFIWPIYEHVSFSSCNPLCHPDDFWEAMHLSQLKQIAKEEVVKSLAEQSISIGQFKILDDLLFSKILEEGKTLLREETVFKCPRDPNKKPCKGYF